MHEYSRRAAVLLAAAGTLGLAGCSAVDTTSAVPAPRASPTPSARVATSAHASAFDRTAESIDAPSSLWVVVNKIRPLAPTYVPATVAVPVPHTNPPLLRAAASAAVVAMFAAARTDGVELASNSTYRSYADQRSVYDGNLTRLGKAGADRLTAHPGCSEHQTGLAIDIGAASGQCSLATCMGDLPEGRWLAANAWRYGFLLRYPADKVAVTGYQYEPWHFRYLGTGLAAELHRRHVQTLEEFFGLPAAPDYA